MKHHSFIDKKVSKKVEVTGNKIPSVHVTTFCKDCKFVSVHSTGSLLWVSCKFQQGWRSINSECCLPVEKQKELQLQ